MQFGMLMFGVAQNPIQNTGFVYYASNHDFSSECIYLINEYSFTINVLSQDKSEWLFRNPMTIANVTWIEATSYPRLQEVQLHCK